MWVNRYERGIWAGSMPTRVESLEAAKKLLGPGIREGGKMGELCAIVRGVHAPARPIYLYKPN